MSVERHFFRIIVAIISGIILAVWNILVCVLLILNFICTLITGKRHRGMAELCEYWNTEFYKFCRYLTFVTNKKPFPFSDVERMGRFS